MKTFNLTILLIISSFNLFGQSSYRGFLGKYPIEFVISGYSYNNVEAFYVYTKFDNPIKLYGVLKEDILLLNEKDSLGKNTSIFKLYSFSEKYKTIYGVWIDLKTKKELNIVLEKKSEIIFNDSTNWENKELLQPESLKDKYFKLVISKAKNDYSERVTGINIYEKKTDILFQQISNLDCQTMTLDNIEVNDYNFDSIPDFSVFESSYAGPNTSRIYFLFDPISGKFFQSSFSGVSLEFDASERRIYEFNQCCGGRITMTSEYKVENNKMILLFKNCKEYDEITDEYKDVKCE